MSKKDGAVFAKSLFGYKKRDVNEYIRLADESNSEKVKEYETRINELEETLSKERTSYQSQVKSLSDEKDDATKKAEIAKLEFNSKLADCEVKCASFIKLADAATLRAESAEALVNELSAQLEIQRTEMNALKAKSETDEKQISQLNAAIVSLSSFEEKERAEKTKFFKLRRPGFFKINRK